MAAQVEKRKRRTRTKVPGVYRSISGKYEIAYRDSDGRLRFETVAGDLEAAKLARADKIVRLGKGEPVRPSRQRFGEYAESIVDACSSRPRTIEKHRYHLQRHLLPRFRNRTLASITTDDVARLVAELQRADRGNGRPAGYAGRTITGALSTLSLVMRKAKRAGLIPANPVSDLEGDERPSLKTAEKRILDEAEIGRVLGEGGDTFRPLIALLIFAGLRLGEALGLTWEDVDFDAGTIHVRYQLDRQRRRVEIKTENGRRDVVLIPQLGKVLREHRMASRRKGAGDFVFPAPDGRGRDHRSTSRGVERAVDRAKLGDGISSHNFRHTFASMLIVGLRLDPVRVSRQLGHAKASFTQDTYTHLFEKARHADALRAELEQGFGHLLTVNGMSTGGRNQPQPAGLPNGEIKPLVG